MTIGTKIGGGRDDDTDGQPVMKARLAQAMPPLPKPMAPAAAPKPLSGPGTPAPAPLRRPGAPEQPPVAAPTASVTAAWRAATRAAIGALHAVRKLSPVLFAGPRAVPMACGIRPEIIRRLGLDDEQDLEALQAILHKTVTRPACPLAVAAKGAMRFNLAGEPVEPVSDEYRAQAQHALEWLKRRRKLQNSALQATPIPLKSLCCAAAYRGVKMIADCCLESAELS